MIVGHCNSTIMLFHHLACIETSKSWAYLTMSLLHTKVLGKSWLVVAEGVLHSNHKTIIAVLINDLNLHLFRSTCMSAAITLFIMVILG